MNSHVNRKVEITANISLVFFMMKWYYVRYLRFVDIVLL